MPDLTTAQRLAAYRDELTREGFERFQVWELVASVAPCLFEDLRVQADVENGPVVNVHSHFAADAGVPPQQLGEALDRAFERGDSRHGVIHVPNAPDAAHV